MWKGRKVFSLGSSRKSHTAKYNWKRECKWSWKNYNLCVSSTVVYVDNYYSTLKSLWYSCQIPWWWNSRPILYFLDSLNMGCSFFVFLSCLQFKMCAHFPFYEKQTYNSSIKKLKNEWDFVLMQGSGSMNWTSFFLICSAGAQPAWIMLVLLGDNDRGDLTGIWDNFSFRVRSRHLNVANLHVTFIPKNVKFVVVTQKDKNHIFLNVRKRS